MLTSQICKQLSATCHHKRQHKDLARQHKDLEVNSSIKDHNHHNGFGQFDMCPSGKHHLLLIDFFIIKATFKNMRLICQIRKLSCQTVFWTNQKYMMITGCDKLGNVYTVEWSCRHFSDTCS